MEVLTTLLSFLAIVLVLLALVCFSNPNAARYVSCVLQARAAAKEAADALYARRYHETLARQVKALKVTPVFGLDPLPFNSQSPRTSHAQTAHPSVSGLVASLHSSSGGKPA